MRAIILACAGLGLVLTGPVQDARAASPAPRQIAPDVVAPPTVGSGQIEREVPRAPLSEIGPAGPPKPKKPKELNGNKLAGSLAVAAGILEVKGITVTLAGLDIVAADETCKSNGADWPCGIRARTAFRGFLRGRAVGCDLPPGTVSGAVSAPCWIGKQDLGEWLVLNGWARAAADGPYKEAGKKAEKAAKGIFGPPPNLNGLLPEPPAFTASTANQQILAATPPELTGAPPSASSGAALPPPAVPSPKPSGATPPTDPQGLY